MHHRTARFKSLAVALKEMEPYVRQTGGEPHLLTGKPFAKFGGMRPREMLANWLMCVAVNSVTQPPERLTFSSDPLGGDGIIVDTVTDETVQTEHVVVPPPRNATPPDIETRILNAVQAKIDKGGDAYARGKTLVVFLEGAGDGPWRPDSVAGKLPNPLRFDAVWVIALQPLNQSGEYNYAVTRLDLTKGHAPVWRVRLARNFDAWTVT